MSNFRRAVHARSFLLGLVLGAWLALGEPARGGPVATFTPLGDLPGGIFSRRAYGVSASGDVVVGVSAIFNGSEAYRWTAATGMVGLGHLPDALPFSLAYGVSADGAVVVGQSETARGNEAFRWTAATGMVGLGE